MFDVSINEAKGGSSTRIFDYNLDFRYYYIDFKKYNVDLLEDNISWFKLNIMLAEFILMKNTRMSEVIGYRTYEKPIKYKTQEAYDSALHAQNIKLKNQYSLPNVSQNTENGFDKMWKFLERKVGGKNE